MEVGSERMRVSPLRAWGALLALVSALGLSAAVQWEVALPGFEQSMPLWWGVAAAVGAIAWRLSSGVAGRTAGGAMPEPDAAPAATAGGAALLLALLALAGGLVLLYGNLRSPAGVILWAAGVLGVPLALGWRERRGRSPAATSARSRRWAAAVALLVLSALALRIDRIESIPAKYLDDEGSVADWGLNYLHGTPFFGQHVAAAAPLFRNGTTAYPLPGSYLHAVVMQVAGETVFGSRVTAAVAGSLGVLVLYLFLRLHVAPWAAFCGAFLLAVCHTHLYWSRSGVPQALTATAISAIMTLTLRALGSRRWSTFAWAGLVLGAAQYLYEGARFFVVVLALFLLLRLLLERGFLRTYWLRGLVMAGMAAAVVAPIGFWYLANPYELIARSQAVFIFSQPAYLESRYPGLDTVGVVLAQLRRALEGFAFRGDGANFFSLRGPIIDPTSRTLLLVGVVGSLALRDRFRLLLALWIWVPIAIVCIPTVDPPSMTRLILVIAPLFAVAALVLERTGEVAVRAAGRIGAAVFGVAVVAGMAYAAHWNWSEFFVRYPSEHVADAQTVGAVLARSRGEGHKTYILEGPYSVWSPAVRFIARGLAGEVLPKGAVPIPDRGWRDGTIVVPPSDAEGLERLRAAYPEAREEIHRDGKGAVLFHAFDVPSAALWRSAPPDAPWATADARIGQRGSEAGELTAGRALIVDPRGFVYVADGGGQRVSVFHPDGHPAFDFAAPGEPGTRGAPSGIALLADGSLLVLELEPVRLARYSADGKWLGDVAVKEVLAAPVAVAAAPEGFYLLDGGLGEVLHVGLDGAIRARGGKRGAGPGELAAPLAMASAGDGRLWVHDRGRARVLSFGPDLSFRGEWPLERPDGRPSQSLAVGAADPEHLYVASPDLGVRRLRLSDGAASWPVGRRGDFPGDLAWPMAVALDARGDLYLWDENRSQVFRYDLSRKPALTRQN